VHRDPGEAGEHAVGVDGLLAAFAMTDQRGEPGTGGHVQQLGAAERGAGGGGERPSPAAAR